MQSHLRFCDCNGIQTPVRGVKKRHNFYQKNAKNLAKFARFFTFLFFFIFIRFYIDLIVLYYYIIDDISVIPPCWIVFAS